MNKLETNNGDIAIKVKSLSKSFEEIYSNMAINTNGTLPGLIIGGIGLILGIIALISAIINYNIFN